MVSAASQPSPDTVKDLLKTWAVELGFDELRVTDTDVSGYVERHRNCIEQGLHGEMSYLERGATKRRDSRLPFAGTRSAVVVALDYGGKAPPGPVARYARGDDYHDVMESRLRDLHNEINSLVGHRVPGKQYVDTGPVLERDLARRAGLGWFGKNTMLINPERGSFFFLGALLLDLELVPDSPFDAERCGRCTRSFADSPSRQMSRSQAGHAGRSCAAPAHRADFHHTNPRRESHLLFQRLHRPPPSARRP